MDLGPGVGPSEMISDPRDIAYVHDCRRFDGLFMTLLDARRALEGTPVRVQVYTCYDPSLRTDYPELGTMIPGYRIPGGGDIERGVNRLLPVFARRLRGIPGDLVHVWSLSLAGLIRYRTDVVVTVPDIAKYTTKYYGAVASFLHNRMLPYLPRARSVACFTEWARADLVEQLHLPPDLVHVISPTPSIEPPPFPLPRTPPPPTVDAPWTLLYVAADRRHKNVEFFLRLLARTDRRFRGLLVTRPTSSTLAMVDRLGIASRLDVRSAVSDLAPMYRSSHVLVHPSLHEGFGLPLLEAMSQGLPVIASNRTCIPEVVGSGGRVIDPVDLRMWVEAIEALTDPDRYRDASRRATGRAADFSVARARKDLVALYAAALR
jgi:glycosyltransferase involved in cell wall biosynthesis